VGAALALALAALLLLAGCGGGDEESGSEGTTAETPAAEAASNPSSAKQSGSSGESPGGQSPTSGQSSGKHGSRIVQPKGRAEHPPSTAERESATVADMVLRIPALTEGASLPAPYTCDGKGTWPALSWEGAPPGSAEVILYAMSAAPVNGKLFVDWAVAGLDPNLESIESGELPPGAILGTNGFGKRGYEICPEGRETFIFAAFALPESLELSPGFDARETRQRILDSSGNVGLVAASYGG
jgi:phosphatidylethanolamine-binding protein (PEBP) family uncharacterized protein